MSGAGLWPHDLQVGDVLLIFVVGLSFTVKSESLDSSDLSLRGSKNYIREGSHIKLCSGTIHSSALGVVHFNARAQAHGHSEVIIHDLLLLRPLLLTIILVNGRAVRGLCQSKIT